MGLRTRIQLSIAQTTNVQIPPQAKAFESCVMQKWRSTVAEMPSLSYGTSHPGCSIPSTLYSSPKEHWKSHRESHTAGLASGALRRDMLFLGAIQTPVLSQEGPRPPLKDTGIFLSTFAHELITLAPPWTLQGQGLFPGPSAVSQLACEKYQMPMERAS